MINSSVATKDAAKRIAELRREIERHNTSYYLFDSPTTSDAEYDRLFRELEDLEGANPELARPDSPTRRPGGQPLEAFKSSEHLGPMLSLANAFEDSEVAEFLERVSKGLGRAEGDLGAPSGCPRGVVRRPRSIRTDTLPTCPPTASGGSATTRRRRA